MKTKDNLTILSLAEWDYAGVGFQLSSALNERDDCESQAVRWGTSYIEYPHQHLQIAPAKLAHLWNRADVIHIHDAFFHIPKGLQEKPVVITYHGSMYRRASAKHNSECAKSGYLMTVATLDLMPLGNVQWMPDTRYPYMVNDRHDKFTVCHAPTSRAGKSTQVVIDACKHANIPLELIEKTTWVDCLERKARCHILVDQFKLGYGCNAIEAWSMGLPVIANADNAIKERMTNTFGVLPFMECVEDFKKLAASIVRLRDSQQEYDKYAQLGSMHFDRYHSPRATAQRATSYYHQAIKDFWRRSPDKETEVSTIGIRGMPGRDGMVLVRYIGGNIGKEEYTGIITGQKYVFSSGDALKYVDARDAQHMLRLKSRSSRAKRPLFVEG